MGRVYGVDPFEVHQPSPLANRRSTQDTTPGSTNVNIDHSKRVLAKSKKDSMIGIVLQIGLGQIIKGFGTRTFSNQTSNHKVNHPNLHSLIISNLH